MAGRRGGGNKSVGGTRLLEMQVVGAVCFGGVEEGEGVVDQGFDPDLFIINMVGGLGYSWSWDKSGLGCCFVFGLV